jgi:S-formylglutathione hydrolase FrmB
VTPASATRLALLLLFIARPAPALDLIHPCSKHQIEYLNAQMRGTLLDYTHNHDRDRRLWSTALNQKRDAYVYLPPGYDGITAFPCMIWMHGFGQDEKTFLDFIPTLDRGIASGQFPPIVIIAPDGSIKGRPSVFNNGSFYMNSKAGNFADYIINDIWPFLQCNFRIRPEREAHVLAGGSMGGYGAFALSFAHRETFGTIAGILPALDIRYADCNDRYFSPYDPNCVMERDHLRRQRIIGKFYGGLILVRERRLTDALLGRRPPDGLQSLSTYNPVEMLESRQIQPGEFNMFIGYAGRDEFNLNAQTDHFLDVARKRGLEVTTIFIPDGKHTSDTGKQVIPAFAKWLCVKLAPYSPAIPIEPSAANTLLGPPKRTLLNPFGLFQRSGPWPSLTQSP